jgi:hypothetical protein
MPPGAGVVCCTTGSSGPPAPAPPAGSLIEPVQPDVTGMSPSANAADRTKSARAVILRLIVVAAIPASSRRHPKDKPSREIRVG